MINETIKELPKDTNDEVTIKRGRGRPRVEPKPKPIKEKKHSLFLDDPKAYFRKYYNDKTKGNIICPNCQKGLTCNSSITRHLKESKNCKIIRLEKLLNNKDEPVD